MREGERGGRGRGMGWRDYLEGTINFTARDFYAQNTIFTKNNIHIELPQVMHVIFMGEFCML